jgi:hypothetical protein
VVTPAERERANLTALDRMCSSEPVLDGVAAARDVVPGMTDRTILTSGPAVPFDRYTGGQRAALVYAALYEGLADSEADAERRMTDGDIVIGACHDHGCVGSVAGVFTASMPVFVVRNDVHGTTGFCNFYEGESRKRLNYGSYDQDVRDQLRHIEHVIAPTIGAAVQRRRCCSAGNCSRICSTPASSTARTCCGRWPTWPPATTSSSGCRWPAGRQWRTPPAISRPAAS